MSIFSDNIRLLRDKLKYSQQKVAEDILITRGRYATYEDGRSEPPIDLLIKLSKYYKVSIDFLVSVDIRKYPLDDLVNLGDNRIIFPIKVDKTGENKIEIITQKASMGYLNGYSDPDYIDALQTISLPFLRNGKFRAFPASGDSMLPTIKDKDTVYVDLERTTVRDGKVFAICHGGLFKFKRLYNLPLGGIRIVSDNAAEFPEERLTAQEVIDQQFEIIGWAWSWQSMESW